MAKKVKMKGIETSSGKTWTFSSDVLSLNESEFKEAMKSTRKDISVKEINEIYKGLHGKDLDIVDEPAKDKK